MLKKQGLQGGNDILSVEHRSAGAQEELVVSTFPFFQKEKYCHELHSCSSHSGQSLNNLIVCSLSVMVNCSSKLARPTIPAIAHYFGTKGRYEEVNRHALDNNSNVNAVRLGPQSSNCRAIYLASVIRHGTRYPTTKNVQKMGRLYDLVVSEASGSASWLRDIKSAWKMWYTEDMDGRLVEKGREDHRSLATRLAKSFPTVISRENLRANRMEFISSSKHRCVDSITAFQQGLHKHWGLQGMDYKHYIDDSLMRFFDQCERFVESVEKNKTAMREVSQFKFSVEMDEVRHKIASRLQVHYHQVTPEIAEAAFFLCSYEFAIKSENSPWCNLLDESDAQVLEYKGDLKQYWKRGYGHEINRKSSCPLFHDIFHRLDKAAHAFRSKGVEKTSTIQVGHGETILPLLSLMGFFKDKKRLTAENFSMQHNRMFRTSRFLPYAANLVFVLYECDGDVGPRLQLFLNERPVAFPHISDPVPLYESVRSQYAQLLHGCDFNTECSVRQKNTEL